VIRSITRLSGVFLVGTAVAHAHGAHEHGVGRLDIAVEKTTIDMDLDSPAVNLIGFEHEPGDAKEKATLEQAITDLKKGGGLMAFTPAAQCLQKKVLVNSEALEHGHGGEHEHHDGKDQAAHDHDEEGGADADEHEDGHDHADLNASWEFNCAHPEALHEIDFKGFFDRFPGTHLLRVQAALPGGQTAVELTPAATTLKM
jgi:hypothetical protein